jgi:glycosyltransferase involved in cell wall biosynthesis
MALDALNDKPAVSVVIATFNRASYLPATIDSVLSQSFTDFELIVVDDGSTDNTREVLAGYGSRLRYFYQANAGASAARNFGVRQARAPWIAFQDSDDLSLPNHLAVLYRYVSQHPRCGMIFANGNYMSGSPQSRGKKIIIEAATSRRLAQRGVRLMDLFEKSILRLQAALISRTAYDLVGGHDESLGICMDLDLGLRLLMNVEVAYLDEALFSYRIHTGNISRNEEQRLSENIRVIEKLIGAYPEARRLIGEKRLARRLAYRYYRLAKKRWHQERHVAARQALDQAVRLRPAHLKYRYYQMQWSLTGGRSAVDSTS